jgi:transcriptional regulator with XRE-family HTH domain
MHKERLIYLVTIDRILNLLKNKGISQTKFAEDLKHLGIKKQSITDWKIGRSTSFYPIILDIANYFNVSTDYLLGSTDDPTPPKKEFTAEDKLNYEISRLTPEKRKQAEQFVEFLKTQEEFAENTKNLLNSSLLKRQTE